jgi:hypothetical protein
MKICPIITLTITDIIKTGSDKTLASVLRSKCSYLSYGIVRELCNDMKQVNI